MFRRRRPPRDEGAGECQGQLLCEAVADEIEAGRAERVPRELLRPIASTAL